jgi:CBS-domain-containing membrane protein
VDEPKSPACVRPDDTLAAAKKLMDAGRFRRLPVIESDKLIGIITERDLRQRWGYLASTKVNAPRCCVHLILRQASWIRGTLQHCFLSIQTHGTT